LAAIVAVAVTVAVAAPAALATHDEAKDPAFYCDGSPDGGASGAFTDAEHTVLVGDPPLPANVRESRQTVDGFATRVLEAGPATAEEAVVFVHGNPGSSRDFDGLLSSTGRFARAVAFDVPGFGRADDRRGGPYTHTGVAAYLNGLLARLGIRRAHLVLHDFGGMWGLEWGAAHGDRLQSVVLMDAGVLIGYTPHRQALVWHFAPSGEASMATMTRESFVTVLQAETPRPMPDDFVNRMYDDFDRATRCAVIHYYREVDDGDAIGRQQAAELRKRPRPALVIWGDQDPYIPAAFAETQREAFPAAEVTVLPNTGHWPFVDEPGKVRDLAIPFLRRVVRSPRIVLKTGRPRAGARRLRVLARVKGAPAIRRARLTLFRGGKLVGASAKPLTLRSVARRGRLDLRRPLRRGRHRLVVASPDLAGPQQVAVAVR
jgi:pimeloyl-ACP methyl ester carboxylesterase